MERRSKLLLRSRVNDGLNSTSGPSPVKRLAAARALAREMWRMLGADDPMEAHKLDSRGRGIYARGRSDDVKEGVTAFLKKRPAVFGLNSSNIKRPRNRSHAAWSPRKGGQDKSQCGSEAFNEKGDLYLLWFACRRNCRPRHEGRARSPASPGNAGIWAANRASLRLLPR